MKKVKTAVSVLALFILSFLCATGIFADEERVKLSPAFDILSSQQSTIKSGLVYEEVKFTLTDFKQYIGIAELDYITVTKAPVATDGALVVGSMTVSDGQRIDASLLPMLTFVAASSDVERASFCFCGDESTSGAEIECTVKMINSVNYAPTVAGVHENRLLLDALNGKSTGGTLVANDPEGDSMCFEIVEYPTHGYLMLADVQSGEYVYTSYESYTGTDSFKYVARDEYGNYTKAVTVNIDVARDRTGIEFADMDASGDVSAASVLVSEGIMNVTARGDGVYFSPDSKVTRADFIVMAMKAAKKAPKKELDTLDGISDAESIEGEPRDYISTAVELGYVDIELSYDGRKMIRADDPITKAEAAKILSGICGYEKVAEDISVFADFYGIDEQTGRCMSAMYEYGVIEFEGGMISPKSNVTRESCARMLYRLMSVI